jgi:hypothetical protein
MKIWQFLLKQITVLNALVHHFNWEYDKNSYNDKLLILQVNENKYERIFLLNHPSPPKKKIKKEEEFPTSANISEVIGAGRNGYHVYKTCNDNRVDTTLFNAQPSKCIQYMTDILS